MEDVSTKGLSTKATGKPLRGRRFTRIASREPNTCKAATLGNLAYQARYQYPQSPHQLYE
jgi:hypothetical protein